MENSKEIKHFDKNIFYKNLNTEFLGREFTYYKTIDSTQSEVWKIAENTANGTLIMSDFQTNGKGTHGRKWYTDEENNIAFSFLIKPNCDINKLDGLTLEIAETILEIFKEEYKINLQIKKPNDIIYNKKKIGGILTETKVISGIVKYLNIGIGINIQKENFSEDLIDIASSIKKEFNIDIDIIKFIAEFCNRFEKKILKRMED